MSSTINASTTSGLVSSADLSGTLELQANGVTKATISSAGFASSGSVIQVVSATTTTQTGTTSSTYINTTLTAAITPKFSTSKILVLVSGNLNLQADNRTAAALGVTRNGTLVFDDQRAMDSGVNANVNMTTRSNIVYLDSPASVSTQTYYVQLARALTAGTSYAVYFPVTSSIATITLMEVAA